MCSCSLPWCKTHFLWVCQRGDYQPGENPGLQDCLKWLQWELLAVGVVLWQEWSWG